MPTYYMQVKQSVLPRLTHYQNDLLEIDRALLRTYTGLFLHSSRDSGTDLMLFDSITSVLSFDSAIVFTLRSNNDLFLQGYRGKVEQITREQATELTSRQIPMIARQIAKHNGFKAGRGDLDAACRKTRQELVNAFHKAIAFHAAQSDLHTKHAPYFHAQLKG